MSSSIVNMSEDAKMLTKAQRDLEEQASEKTIDTPYSSTYLSA
jgi:hypothetical protein